MKDGPVQPLSDEKDWWLRGKVTQFENKHGRSAELESMQQVSSIRKHITILGVVNRERALHANFREKASIAS